MAKNKIILILIILLGIGLRYIRADQSFWLDEAAQAVLSTPSVTSIWYGRGGDFHPPLFYLLSHFWLLGGKSEIWLRTLPIIFGVLTIYLIFLVGEKLYSEKVGLLAAFFLSINPFHVYYSQEFRMYSLLCLLAVWSIYLMLKNSRYLFIINALLLYTHYSAVYVLLTQFVYLLLTQRQKLISWFLQLGLSIVLFLPWLPQFITQFKTGVNVDQYLPGWRSVLTIPAFKAIPTIIFKFVAGRVNLFPKVIYGAYILVVLLITSLAFWLAKEKRSFLSIWIAVPILASIIISFWVPQTQPFRLIFVLPIIILVFAKAASRFPRFFVSFIVYFAVVGLVLTFSRPRLLRETWRETASFLQLENSPVIVKFPEAFAPLRWYTPNLVVIGAVPSFPAKSNEVSQRLQVLSPEDKRVFVLEYLQDLTDPTREVEQKLLELGYQKSNGYDFSGVGLIYKFERP